MSQAVSIILDRVRARVREDGADLQTVGVVERYVSDEIQRYSERALGGSLPMLADEGHATRLVIATLTGYGPLQALLDDDTIEEIWINAPDRASAIDTLRIRRRVYCVSKSHDRSAYANV